MAQQLHRLGKGRFDADDTMRLALQRAWIALGEAARRYCEAEDVSRGSEPWSDMARLRDKLAHLLLDEVVPDLLWAVGERDLPAWLHAIDELL
ncbi:MAG: HepT-like ribonuclease domain-containing protein [Acidimicrobiales bacterium]